MAQDINLFRTLAWAQIPSPEGLGFRVFGEAWEGKLGGIGLGSGLGTCPQPRLGQLSETTLLGQQRERDTFQTRAAWGIRLGKIGLGPAPGLGLNPKAHTPGVSNQTFNP